MISFNNIRDQTIILRNINGEITDYTENEFNSLCYNTNDNIKWMNHLS